MRQLLRTMIDKKVDTKDSAWAKIFGTFIVYFFSWGVIETLTRNSLPDWSIRTVAFFSMLAYLGAFYYMIIQVNVFDVSEYEYVCESSDVSGGYCITSCKDCSIVKQAIKDAAVFYSFQAQTLRAFKYAFNGVTLPVWSLIWIYIKVSNFFKAKGNTLKKQGVV